MTRQMSRARYKGVWELAPGKFVYPQTDEYKANGRKIAVKLGKLWSPPRYFYHYRDGGHIAALRVHEPNEFKATIDLEAFFDHVTRTKVVRALTKLGYRIGERRRVSSESCVRKGHGHSIPYGFAQSPILASICLDMSALGRSLRQIDEGDMEVAVYVDDIIISGNDREKLTATHQALLTAARIAGFPANSNKSAPPRKSVRSFNIELTDKLEVTAAKFLAFQEDALLNRDTLRADAIAKYVTGVNTGQGDVVRRLAVSAPRPPPTHK